MRDIDFDLKWYKTSFNNKLKNKITKQLESLIGTEVCHNALQKQLNKLSRKQEELLVALLNTMSLFIIIGVQIT